MCLKFLISFLSVAIVIQVANTSPGREKRDAPTAEEAGKVIGDVFDSFKTNADSLIKNIKDSDVYKDVSEVFAKFGKSIQNEASNLMEKVKNV
ncbi:hypothetical protein FQA39_LY14880 [Lamprigera yunnana]|nr:hypothetical protein FQA39_LY14880 [Lamprigera yunnana]